jgi:hypothetical protein
MYKCVCVCVCVCIISSASLYDHYVHGDYLQESE